MSIEAGKSGLVFTSGTAVATPGLWFVGPMAGASNSNPKGWNAIAETLTEEPYTANVLVFVPTDALIGSYELNYGNQLNGGFSVVHPGSEGTAPPGDGCCGGGDPCGGAS